MRPCLIGRNKLSSIIAQTEFKLLNSNRDSVNRKLR